uniref:Rho-GAP domain-containing protein n=2 Tax=Denticeps clupeoides TaxID=299321 RepID=A0AAY4BEL7_9TELE
MELLPRDLPVPRFFIRARTLKHPLAAADISQKNRRKRSILKWPLRRGPNSNSSSLGGSTHTPLFGQPLSSICSHGNLPQVIMDMLCLLYREGPDTQGIFRRSANAKNCRLLKEKLNAGLCALPDGESVFVAASIFTDFLRHLPGSILGCHLYKKWMEVMEKKEEEQKDLITSLLAQLPEGNTLLLRYVFWLLYRIQACSQENQMSASNLALCIAPNMLWLPEPSRPEEEGQATRKVAALVELLIENTPSIFGEDVGSLLSERKTSREECEASGDPFPQLCSSDEADAEPTLYRTKNLSSSSLVSSDPFFPPLATLSLRDKGDFPASSASSVSVCSLPGRVPCLSPSRDRCSSEPTVCPVTPHAIIGRQLSCDAAVMCNASHQSQTLSSKTPRLQIHHALRGDASPRAGAGRHYTLWRSPPIPQRFRHAARRLPSMSSLSSTATSSLSSLDSALSLTSSEPLSSPNDTVPRPFLFGAAARLRPLTPDTPRKFPPEWSMAFPYKENEDGGAVEGERDPEIEEEAEDGVIFFDKAEKCQGKVTKDVTEGDSGENDSLNCSDKGMGGVIFTVRPGGPLKENGAQVACREESQQGERTPTGVTCQPRETSVAHIHLSRSNTLAHAHLHTLPPTADAEGRSRTKITLYASSGTLQVKQPAVQMAAKEDGRSLVATETAGSHTVRLWIPQTVFYGQSAPLVLRSAPAREPAHPITHSTSIAKADTELVVPGEGTNYGEDDNKGVPEGVTLGLPQSKRASTLISPKPQGIHHTIRIRLPGRVRNTVREYFSHGERRSSHPATVEREFVVRKLHWKRKTPHGAAAEDSAVTPDGDESVV